MTFNIAIFESKKLWLFIFANIIVIFQMEEEKQKCTNCHREFPVDKIDLHEAYCCRNIRECKQCGEMIDINNMEDHNNEKHSKKACPHCNEQFEPNLIQSHQNKCLKKPVICQYCENTQHFGEIQRHQQMCGARTKPCSLCQKLVMLKDFALHESNCVGRNNERRQQRSEISQDHYMPNRRNNQNRGQRQRQNSTNVRQVSNRSNSVQHKIPKPLKIKPSNIIGPQAIKQVIDPVPISVRMALKTKDPRVPLKSKN